MATQARPTSYDDALRMAAALRASQTAPDPVQVVQSMSRQMIATREHSAAMAKSAIKALWRSVDPYDDVQVRAFAVEATRLMVVAQTAAARIAAAGQVQQLAAMGVKAAAAPSNPVDVRGLGIIVKRGKVTLDRSLSTVHYDGASTVYVTAKDKSTEAVFRRPAMAYRYEASRGSPTAEQAANQRIDDLVDTNLMLAQRLAQQEVLAQAVDLNRGGGPQIIGHRRVIHPEMSKGGTCGMCIAASHRLYRVDELMPIHDRCECTSAAVTKDHDPADELNTSDLDLYGDAGGNTAAHLKRTRYQIDEHGELGPVLVPKKPYKPRKAKPGGKRAKARPESAADVARRNLPLFRDHLAKMLTDGVPEDSPKVAYMRRMIHRFADAS